MPRPPNGYQLILDQKHHAIQTPQSSPQLHHVSFLPHLRALRPGPLLPYSPPGILRESNHHLRWLHPPPALPRNLHRNCLRTDPTLPFPKIPTSPNHPTPSIPTSASDIRHAKHITNHQSPQIEIPIILQFFIYSIIRRTAIHNACNEQQHNPTTLSIPKNQRPKKIIPPLHPTPTTHPHPRRFLPPTLQQPQKRMVQPPSQHPHNHHHHSLLLPPSLHLTHRPPRLRRPRRLAPRLRPRRHPCLRIDKLPPRTPRHSRTRLPAILAPPPPPLPNRPQQPRIPPKPALRNEHQNLSRRLLRRLRKLQQFKNCRVQFSAE